MSRLIKDTNDEYESIHLQEMKENIINQIFEENSYDVANFENDCQGLILSNYPNTQIHLNIANLQSECGKYGSLKEQGDEESLQEMNYLIHSQLNQLQINDFKNHLQNQQNNQKISTSNDQDKASIRIQDTTINQNHQKDQLSQKQICQSTDQQTTNQKDSQELSNEDLIEQTKQLIEKKKYVKELKKISKNLYSQQIEFKHLPIFMFFIQKFTILCKDDKVWHYLGNNNEIQGPFSSLQMDIWNMKNYFCPQLAIYWMQRQESMEISEFYKKPLQIIKISFKFNFQRVKSIFHPNIIKKAMKLKDDKFIKKVKQKSIKQDDKDYQFQNNAVQNVEQMIDESINEYKQEPCKQMSNKPEYQIHKDTNSVNLENSLKNISIQFANHQQVQFSQNNYQQPNYNDQQQQFNQGGQYQFGQISQSDNNHDEINFYNNWNNQYNQSNLNQQQPQLKQKQVQQKHQLRVQNQIDYSGIINQQQFQTGNQYMNANNQQQFQQQFSNQYTIQTYCRDINHNDKGNYKNKKKKMDKNQTNTMQQINKHLENSNNNNQYEQQLGWSVYQNQVFKQSNDIFDQHEYYESQNQCINHQKNQYGYQQSTNNQLRCNQKYQNSNKQSTQYNFQSKQQDQQLQSRHVNVHNSKSQQLRHDWYQQHQNKFNIYSNFHQLDYEKNLDQQV